MGHFLCPLKWTSSSDSEGAEYWTMACAVENPLGLIQMKYQKTAKQCRLVGCPCSVPTAFHMCSVALVHSD